MANEISATISVAITPNSGNTASGSASFLSDSGGNGVIGNEQIVGTADETLVLGDVGTPKMVFIKNLDETNYVEVDSASTYDKFPQKLLPGQAVVLIPETGTIHIKANTAPVKVWVVAG